MYCTAKERAAATALVKRSEALAKGHTAVDGCTGSGVVVLVDEIDVEVVEVVEVPWWPMSHPNVPATTTSNAASTAPLRFMIGHQPF
jgi:hypothetical protein